MSTLRGKTLGAELALAQLDARYATPTPSAGQYFYTTSPQAVSTDNAHGIGLARLLPWLVRTTTTIDRLGAEVTAVGDAGSKFRIFLYSDAGNCIPGALVVDAGQIAGDSATVQELTIAATTLTPGLYWIGGAVQAVTSLQPTMRTSNAPTPPVLLGLGATLPTVGGTLVGVQNGGYSGVPAANWGVAAAGTSRGARVFARAA